MSEGSYPSEDSGQLATRRAPWCGGGWASDSSGWVCRHVDMETRVPSGCVSGGTNGGTVTAVLRGCCIHGGMDLDVEAAMGGCVGGCVGVGGGGSGRG